MKKLHRSTAPPGLSNATAIKTGTTSTTSASTTALNDTTRGALIASG